MERSEEKREEKGKIVITNPSIEKYLYTTNGDIYIYIYIYILVV